MAIKHYKDLLGSELKLNTKSYRRQSAVRRGVVTGIDDKTNQESLAIAAASIASDLGSYHPHASSLPLQNISVRRIGPDRAEYAAEYGHTGSSFGDQSRVTIEVGGFAGPAFIPWGSEVASGRRWTPNEQPPFYAAVPATFVDLRRTATFGSLSAIESLISSNALIGKINNANVTVGGIVYPQYALKFEGFACDYDPSNLGGGVDVTYLFSMRRFVDADGNARGWVQGAYDRISSRPYWSAVWKPLAQSASFATLPGL